MGFSFDRSFEKVHRATSFQKVVKEEEEEEKDEEKKVR